MCPCNHPAYSREREAALSEPTKTSKQILNELLDNHYRQALEAKKEGRPVCWSTSIAPQELLETLGITTVYPENHAAAIGARKEAPTFIARAEGLGYSADNCSYARVNFGYSEIRESVAGNIPMPDLLFCSSNICHTVIKWYENLSKRFAIPLVMIDMPFNHTSEVLPNNVAYMRNQLLEAIKQLEGITKIKFDHDRFREVMRVSNETSSWWFKACSLGKHIPSPLNGFDMFNYMAVVVCMRGNPAGRDMFKLWYEELAEKAENGIGPWKDAEEKYRIIWDGIACWPHLGDTYKVLKRNGLNMVTSTYPASWNIIYGQDDLDGMARAYSGNVFANRDLEHGASNLANLVREYSIDGIVYHSNRSCKLMDFRQYEIQRRVEQKTGVASVIFDGDQTDPRVFSLAQYETRIQALMEMMEANKAKRRAEA